jgi:hypothetical protein
MSSIALRGRPRAAAIPVAGWTNLISISLAAVSAVGAVITLVVPGVLRGTTVMNGSARGTALIVLVAAVPVLVVSMVLVARGGVRPVITWLGAAAYLLYNAVMFLIATPFNAAFLLYVAMFGTSLWTIVLVLHDIDVPALARRFSPKLPARVLAAFLGAIAILNTFAWLAGAVPGLFSSGSPAFLEGTGLITMPTYVQDLSFWLPLTMVVAIWLWQRKAWGIVLGGALIVYGIIEGIGVATDQAFGHAADPSSNVVAVAAVPGFLVVAAIEVVAFYLYIRTLNRA